MKKYWKLFCSFGFCCVLTSAHGSFLHSGDFPKTFGDLPFFERMAFKQKTWEDIESVYDNDGNCVSGCAFVMPKWEDEVADMEKQNQLVHQNLIEQHGYTENSDGTLTPPVEQPITPKTPVLNPPAPPVVVPEPPVPPACKNRNASFGKRDIPYGNPLGYKACITSDYGVTRTLDGETKTHHGIDFGVREGTPVYAAGNGVVNKVVINKKNGKNEGCGTFVKIKHQSGDDVYYTIYCHLQYDSVLVKEGDTLLAGCLIAKSGNTGHSTGPHLHYAIKNKNDKYVNPKDFIESGHQKCK
ncbi:MAG: M23 family metallopeptidase [Alphaproteobacteria bacterium]|nr:M23 family metallopeptidase [Alphaproteobacteria bacterium]